MHSIITLYFLYDFHFCVFILKCHQFESFQNEIHIVYCIYLLKCVLFVTGNWIDIAYYEKVLKKWPMFLPTYILWMCRKTDVIYCVIYQVFLFSAISIIYWLELSISFIYSASINLTPTNHPSHSQERNEGSLNANEMVTKYPSPINWILCVFISSNMCLSQPKRNILLRSPELLRI